MTVLSRRFLPMRQGFGGKCPRCGQGALFGTFLGLKEHAATSCGLEYAKADAGDGPAVFVIFIVGFVAVAVAFIAQDLRLVSRQSGSHSACLRQLAIMRSSLRFCCVR